MGVLSFVRKHLTDAGFPPTAPLPPSSLNGHKLADGLNRDYWFQMYLDAEPTNEGLSDDGRKLINAPLRTALLVSSAAIAGVDTLTAFSKSAVLLAGHADLPTSQIEISAGGRISTMAGTPGGIEIALTLAGQTAVIMGTAGDLRPSISQAQWSLLTRITARTIGATASLWPMFNLGLLPTLTPVVITPTIGFVANLTVDRTVQIFANWDTANAANSIVMDHLDIRVSPAGTPAT